VSITAPLAGSILTSTTTVSATASDNVGVAGVQFKLDGASLGSEVTSTPYSLSWNPSTTTNGAHSLTAVARDAAGNTTTSGAVPVTVNVVVDVTPPVISGVSASGISASGSTIAWTTNESANSQVEYGLTVAYGSSTTLDASSVTTHSESVSGLAASTLYHYRVKSRDSAGNLGTSADFMFTTNAVAGPVARWAFDEGSGTVAGDSTGNGNAGTLVNGPTWTAGRINQALSFDGVNDYVTIPDSPALDAFPFTIAVWMKTSTTSGVRGIVNKYVASSSNGYNVFMNGGNLCAWYYRDGSNYVYDGGGCTLSTAGLNDNRWHLVVYAVDAAGGRLYVDAVLKASLGWTGVSGAPTTTQPVHIAHYPGAFGGAEYLPGALDDVRIYNRALSVAEISALYSIPPSAPVGLKVVRP
jgi:hypothetical protein